MRFVFYWLLFQFSANAFADYPVTLFRDQLKSLEDAKKAYQADFERGMTLKIKLDDKDARVRSCSKFDESVESGWKFQLDERDQRSINDSIALSARCGILKTLVRLKASKTSFIRHIPFNQYFIRYLPADIYSLFAMSSDYDKIYKRAEETNTSYCSLNRALEDKSPKFVKGQDPNRLHFSRAFFVDRQAMGDANGDGIEDLIVRLVEDSGGSMQIIQFLTLTQFSNDDILVPLKKIGQPKKGCSGDEIDRMRSKFTSDFKRPFKIDALNYLENNIEKCKEFSPQLHLLWLMSDAAFVSYQLGKLDGCRKHLELSQKLVKEIEWYLVPPKLKKAILHNKKICQFAGQF